MISNCVYWGTELTAETHEESIKLRKVAELLKGVSGGGYEAWSEHDVCELDRDGKGRVRLSIVR